MWLALGQPADGTIVTIDPDTERTDLARGWWRQAGIPDERITVVNARALDAFERDDPALSGPFDLAFIDALKPEYGAYLDALTAGRLAPDALVLADNVLWSGRVSGATPVDGDEPSTEAPAHSAGGYSRTIASRRPSCPSATGCSSRRGAGDRRRGRAHPRPPLRDPA